MNAASAFGVDQVVCYFFCTLSSSGSISDSPSSQKIEIFCHPERHPASCRSVEMYRTFGEVMVEHLRHGYSL